MGSKNLVTKKYAFEKFKKIESSDTFKVIIEQSDTYSLEGDMLIEKLDISLSGASDIDR